MMRLRQVLALARTELRLARRLARYWVFLTLSYLVGIGAYFYFATLHGLFSSYSGTVASVGPRFLVGAFGLYYFLIFMVGVVFLGFDVRSRDQRERVIEVLDSRPYTNLELVVGRFFGLLLATWIPLVLLAVIWQLFGMILPALGSPIGEPIETYSLVALTFFMSLPGMAFVLALVFLVTLLVRNRLLAAVLLLVLLGVDFWAVMALPLTYLPLCDLSGTYTANYPSDVVPGIADMAGWLQRAAVLLAALAMLGFAAAIHPRLDGGSRPKTAVGAAMLAVLAIAGAGFGVFRNTSDLGALEAWRTAHASRASTPVADLRSIVGEVTIDPGRSLELELDLTLRAPAGKPLASVLFTFNPGLTVRALDDSSGAHLTFTHADGLLDCELPVPLEPDAETTLHLSAAGLPDRLFGYLDSARTPETIRAYDGQLLLLGIERAIFEPRYVALMPGIRWLPATGSETDRDDPGKRAVDFFDVDLTVDLPRDWLVAGPGRRRDEPSSAERARFRFAPPAPVPEVALIASRFESRSVEMKGVLLEILVHPRHTRNLEVLAAGADEMRTWIEEHLSESKEAGLGYPYGALTLVEVPNTLRGFVGGWRMDTALAPPAMVLMRESSFPTARFDNAFRDPDKFKDREGGLPRAMMERVYAFFVNDFSGGNVFTGAARNAFANQTSARGPEGLALNYVMETLAARVTTETRGYFSVHLFDSEIGQTVTETIQTFFVDPSPGRTFAEAAISAVTSRPGVWDTALDVALTDLDPWLDPARTVDVLTLKGGAVAQSILDALGPAKTRKLLASLRETHRGRSFSFDDLIAAGRDLDENLEELLGDWLSSTELPGFVGGNTRAYRLPDTEDGTPRYQLLVVVRNDESVPGLFRVHYWVGNRNERDRVKSDPIRLEGKRAVRFAAISSRPPVAVQVEPYLALNRTSFRVPLAAMDKEKMVDQEPLEGTENVPWVEPEEESIVVDDLDEGFHTTAADEADGLRLGARTEEGEMDQGLPRRAFNSRPSNWSRGVSSEAWGKYRHTMAVVKAGSGTRSAVFTATIPRAGKWDLELHMTSRRGVSGVWRWGTWHLTVGDGSAEEEVEFDSDGSVQGWNLVGSYELPEGRATVKFSNKTDGQVVVADAIRWSPAAGNSDKEKP